MSSIIFVITSLLFILFINSKLRNHSVRKIETFLSFFCSLILLNFISILLWEWIKFSFKRSFVNFFKFILQSSDFIIYERIIITLKKYLFFIMIGDILRNLFEYKSFSFLILFIFITLNKIVKVEKKGDQDVIIFQILNYSISHLDKIS